MPAPSSRKAPDRQTLIQTVKAAATKLGGKILTQADFRSLTGISRYQVLRYFDSFSELLRAAGLTAYDERRRTPDEALLRTMAEIFRKEGGVVPMLRFGKLSGYSQTVLQRRWGGWGRALQAFRRWQSDNDPDFPYTSQLEAIRLPGPARGHRLPRWSAHGGRQYGEALNFRGLLHAPVNEQGVVFLFATLAADLGFLVESLIPGFPDCEAKRRVGPTWERVRIEFEYESRNFRLHRHDPQHCDLIVCWEHNWPECPIEVLELKKLLTGRLETQLASRLRSDNTPRAPLSTAHTGGRLGPDRDAADGIVPSAIER